MLPSLNRLSVEPTAMKKSNTEDDNVPYFPDDVIEQIVRRLADDGTEEEVCKKVEALLRVDKAFKRAIDDDKTFEKLVDKLYWYWKFPIDRFGFKTWFQSMCTVTSWSLEDFEMKLMLQDWPDIVRAVEEEIATALQCAIFVRLLLLDYFTTDRAAGAFSIGDDEGDSLLFFLLVRKPELLSQPYARHLAMFTTSLLSRAADVNINVIFSFVLTSVSEQTFDSQDFSESALTKFFGSTDLHRIFDRPSVFSASNFSAWLLPRITVWTRRLAFNLVTRTTISAETIALRMPESLKRDFPFWWLELKSAIEMKNETLMQRIYTIVGGLSEMRDMLENHKQFYQFDTKPFTK